MEESNPNNANPKTLFEMIHYSPMIAFNARYFKSSLKKITWPISYLIIKKNDHEIMQSKGFHWLCHHGVKAMLYNVLQKMVNVHAIFWALLLLFLISFLNLVSIF